MTILHPTTTPSRHLRDLRERVPHDSCGVAKRRARARQRGAGAVLFIVVTTLGVLAVMGVYALSATTADLRAAGYVQRATQAAYIGDYGAVAVADYITYENADNIVNARMLNPNLAAPNSSDVNCLSTQRNDPALVGSNRAKSCVRIAASELKAAWGTREPFTTQSFQHAALATEEMTGDVYVEITNPTQAPAPPGYDVNLRLKFAMVTVTSYGVIQPLGPTGPPSATTMQVGRGRFIIGPLSN